jgi:hypothetical protein
MSADKIAARVVRTTEISQTLINEILARDASLWLGTGVGENADDTTAMAQLATLPWRAVAVESSSSTLATAIASHKDQEGLVPRRGYVDVIAANPVDILLATRTLPVFLLNGREDSTDPLESAQLPRQKGLFRRLSMLSRLQQETPRHLVFVSSGDGQLISEFRELWGEGFRARITFVTDAEVEITALGEMVSSLRSAPTITLVTLSPKQFAERLSSATLALIAPDSLTVRIRSLDKSTVIVDASACDLPDQPILDRYELLRESDLTLLLPEDLKSEEIDAFFRGSESRRNWRIHAAGLPWLKDDICERELLNRLRKLHASGSDGNAAALIVAEPGSGGTTLMERLTYAAAIEGYPSIVARPVSFDPNATELVGFLNRLAFAHSRTLDATNESSKHRETPVIVAFDTQHWRGHEEGIATFVKKLERSGRSALLLVVTDFDGADRVSQEVCTHLDVPLCHQFTEDDASHLGRHLNKYLEPKGSARSDNEWRSFHKSQLPAIGDFGATQVSFWIALEFWLKRQLQLGETIQGWLYKQFHEADLPPDLALLVLQIAAMTIERVGTSEDLFPDPVGSNLPQSIRLQEVQGKAPALGLVRSKSASVSQWTLGHPLLARYLLGVIIRDRPTLEILELGHLLSTTQLRLTLLGSIACSPELGTLRHRDLAIYFATTILKLDRDGNREFFHEWRHVLQILESVPQRVWETSRAFNHHVAISRRRIASDEEYFPLSLQEKQEQLLAAAEHIDFALNRIDESDNDDTTLNLLNSLARCFQDLLSLAEGALADKSLASEYRSRASECVQRAFELSPLNSYVLETRARELILSATNCAEKDPTNAAALACDALDCIQRALNLESAPARQSRLHDLLRQTFQLLSTRNVTKQLAVLRARRDPIGLIGTAWLELRGNLAPGELLDYRDLDKGQIDRALNLLDEIPAGQRKPLDLRLAYELHVIKAPNDFQRQVEFMEEISRESRQLDLQSRLELAILLYQVGRVPEGASLFDSLRPALRNSDTFVSVPDRLRTLRKLNSADPLVCQASFSSVDAYGKQWAKVQELGRSEAPFNSYEFVGEMQMEPKRRFHCVVTFGRNGPFLRPREEING